MGTIISTLKDYFKSSKPQQISMVGLDGAGKTTILMFMKHRGGQIATIPTIGFNTEEFTINNTKFNLWDLGGQESIRAMWQTYITDSAGLIFVIDIMDKNRWETASEALNKGVENFNNKPVLILLNKADLNDDAAYQDDVKELKKILNVEKWERKNEYHMALVSALENEKTNSSPQERLDPAFAWLSDHLKDA